ncbi:hypothetical protein T10_363 [Trichinella papuae]|uniref:Uncharacterized protein n=1 Tax=Trichinella papuae TaxID=268474 RepID=A0A0V1MUX9_9BILA|nr:hypothetical protein T10_363 [Trichinella papuae]
MKTNIAFFAHILCASYAYFTASLWSCTKNMVYTIKSSQQAEDNMAIKFHVDESSFLDKTVNTPRCHGCHVQRIDKQKPIPFFWLLWSGNILLPIDQECLLLPYQCYIIELNWASLKAPRFCFISSLSGNIIFAAPSVRYGQIVPVALMLNSANLINRAFTDFDIWVWYNPSSRSDIAGKLLQTMLEEWL